MATLRRLKLVDALREMVASGKPLVGICLGMQLLMTRSEEFGRHEGLGILEGEVVRLEPPRAGDMTLKVPQVGWNRILKPSAHSWEGTPLEGLPDGAWMYFVHSFYVKPAEASLVCARTRYGPIEFCSSLRDENIFACQFHPERSGPEGLMIYRNIARWIVQQQEVHCA
jgi:glutamine amidotransferase